MPLSIAFCWIEGTKVVGRKGTAGDVTMILVLWDWLWLCHCDFMGLGMCKNTVKS